MIEGFLHGSLVFEYKMETTTQQSSFVAATTSKLEATFIVHQLLICFLLISGYQHQRTTSHLNQVTTQNILLINN